MPGANPSLLRLGVLDQAPIAEGSTGGQALRNSIDLAQSCDRLGYHRYWVSEHHATPMLACNSPEVLMGPLAAATRRIRIGSGGIMLPHYSPLKVAENFSMLSGLYPGRIDLGIGRAPGSDPRTAYALQRDRRQAAPDDFPQQLAELMAYLDDRMPPEHLFASLAKTLPCRPEVPEIWLLGSSAQSGIWAAELGLPYMYADFFGSNGSGYAERYRREFEPSEHLARPLQGIALSVVCADTDEEAWRLTASMRMAVLLLHRGKLIQIPPAEAALDYLEKEFGSRDAAPPGRRMIAGTPETVRAGIEAAVAEYGAEEVLIVTMVHDHAKRRRSYELVAEAFGLTADQAEAR